MVKINRIKIEPKSFPDNSLLLKLPIEIKSENTMEWYYENDAELFTLICARRHLGDAKVSLYMPYIPHARMDRVKAAEDVFTLKYFCEIINSLNFDKVLVLDAHSSVSLALLERVKEIKPTAFIDEAISLIDSDSLIAFYPDEGAMKRYSDSLELPYSFGIKKRDWKTGKIEGLTLMNKDKVYNRDILIIDDICSYGGTFLHAAKALKEAGARNVYLYVSHLEKSVLDGELYKEMCEHGLIKQIYSPDILWDCNRNNRMITEIY